MISHHVYSQHGHLGMDLPSITIAFNLFPPFEYATDSTPSQQNSSPLQVALTQLLNNSPQPFNGYPCLAPDAF